MKTRYVWTAAATVVMAVLISAPAIAADDDASGSKVTFTKDIEVILQQNCQVCHRPEGANMGGMVAPMALVTYEGVRPWARSISDKVKNREMPPWDASPEQAGVFENERTLTQAQIDRIVKWVETGAPRGNPEDAPEPLVWPEIGGWQIGEPDLIVTMPEPFFVGDDVVDHYQTFTTEITEEQMPEDRVIKAIEFKPGSSVVHHIIGMPLGGIAPGNGPTIYGEGWGRLLRKGTRVSFQMHYHKEAGPGTGVWDQSSVAVKFYPKDAKVEHQLESDMLGNPMFNIPAGDPNYSISATFTFPDEALIVGLMPHMHLRGKSAFYEVTYPDGSKEVLLDVPQYDFNWQTTYKFKEPKVVPEGTKIELTMTWDNSAENESNPDSTRNVRFGRKTTDEMMFGFMSFAYTDPERAATKIPEGDRRGFFGGRNRGGGGQDQRERLREFRERRQERLGNREGRSSSGN